MDSAKQGLKIQPQDIRKILVVNLGGIGDVLLSTPALRALKSHFRQASLYLLVVGRVTPLVKTFPYVDNVFIFELGNPLLYGLGNLKNILVLRKEKIDLAINMRTLVSNSSAAKIKFLLKFINPKIKAGRNTAGRGEFFDIAIPEEEIGEKFEMEYDIEMAEALGAKVIGRAIDFEIEPSSTQKVNTLIVKSGDSDNEILIGIHPGGKPAHRWPEENFSEVMIRLNRQINCSFVMTGSKDEYALVERIIRKSKVKALNLAGKLNIAELGEVLKRCNLYISNDTAAMHIAAIVRTPLVALFGPGYVSRYNPQKIFEQVIVLYQKADCSPCNKFACKALKCLKAINPQQVLEASLSLLGDRYSKNEK